MKNSKNILLAVIFTAAIIINYTFAGYGIIKILNSKKTPTAETKTASINSIYESDNSYVKDNEDLLNVDYKTYYDDLKPYGTWIAVNLSTKNVNLKSSGNQKGISEILRNVLGIRDAKADIDFGWSVFYVWKPSPNLAIGISAGEPYPAYVPYTNGRWVYSDYGWYFRAATPCEEITHHYGRWAFVPSEGWIWIPGSVWAPAWVSWEDNDDYVAWTPCTPGITFAAEYFNIPYYPENNYIVCERRHFLDPDLYRFSRSYREPEFERRYVNMRNEGNVMHAGKFDYNSGPEPGRFEKDYGRKINPVNINMVSNKEQVRYDKNRYNVYAPVTAGKNLRTNDFGSTGRQTFSRNFDKNQKQTDAVRENKNMRNTSFNDKRNNNIQNRTQKENRNGKNDISVNTRTRNNGDKSSIGKNDNKHNFGNDNNKNRNERIRRDNGNGNVKNKTGRNMQDNRNNNSVRNKNTGNNYFSPQNRQNRNTVSNRKYMDDTKMHPGNEFKNRRNANDGGVNKNNNNKKRQ
jgi:hypothetical protein